MELVNNYKLQFISEIGLKYNQSFYFKRKNKKMSWGDDFVTHNIII